MNSGETVNILFVCVGNSARSQMAEGLTNHLAKTRSARYSLVARSCGSRPGPRINRHSIAVMREIGVDIDHGHGPQHYEKVNRELAESGRSFDFIISVCEENAKECPVIPSPTAVSVDWRIPDPAALERVGENEEDRLYNEQVHRHTRDILEDRIKLLIDYFNIDGWYADSKDKAADLGRIHDDLFWSSDVRNHAEGFAKLGEIEPLWGKCPRIVEDDVCFLSMPFKAAWSGAVRVVIEAAADEAGFRCIRADEDRDKRVMEGVWKRICTARVMIADLSDRNPNVAYEVGLADAIGTEVILLFEKQTTVPFNFLNVRYIPYDSSPAGHRQLAEDIKKRLSELRSPRPSTG